MADTTTLLAYLVPKLYNQVENAATYALAFILNKSDGAMQALNGLLREGGYGIEPIVHVHTQVRYEDGSQPDMVGYDMTNATRLLVEAKFDAPLLKGQASWYGRLLNQPGPAALLFIVPERRIPTVWGEIKRQMKEQSNLELIDSTLGIRRAKVHWIEPTQTELHLVLIGWVRLLERMYAMAEDEGSKSDIRQLRGLAQEQDEKAFSPIRPEELHADLALRLVWYNLFVDRVVDVEGVPQEWLDTKGFLATPQRHGYGRYCRFSGTSKSNQLWFGVNNELWAREGDTPLWLRVWGLTGAMVDEIEKELDVQMNNGWIPISLKTGVDHNELLEDVVSQLKKIGEVIGVEQATE